jgi:hypothetical protein
MQFTGVPVLLPCQHQAEQCVSSFMASSVGCKMATCLSSPRYSFLFPFSNLFNLCKVHATSAALKAHTTLVASAGMEAARKACGGHGFSQLSQLPEVPPPPSSLSSSSQLSSQIPLPGRLKSSSPLDRSHRVFRRSQFSTYMPTSLTAVHRQLPRDVHGRGHIRGAVPADCSLPHPRRRRRRRGMFSLLLISY